MEQNESTDELYSAGFQDFVIDLTNCDREPIHIPSAIQPHGLLFCIAPDFKILQCSENTIQFLGVAALDLIGQSLMDLMDITHQGLLKVFLELENLKTIVPLALELKTKLGVPISVTCFAHRYSSHLILEFEPTSVVESTPQVLVPGKLTASIDALQRPNNLLDALQSAASSVKHLTGYDRVMIYRFDKEWNGEVIAESKESKLEPLLGLHYPASDIPVQARILYQRNLLRMIADVDYNSVKVVPSANNLPGGVLDMSDCVLRSVSPIHVEYLGNMGVKATLTISLMVQGNLWGLIACHHYNKKYLPLWMRSACELFGQLVALRILGFLDAEQYKSQAHSSALFDEVVQVWLKKDTSLLKKFDAVAERILQVFDCTGAAIFAEDGVATVGIVPSVTDMRSMLPFLERSALVVYTDCLSKFIPDVSMPGFAGLLAVRVGSLRGEWLLCFRPEQTFLVNWAGDPHKSVEVSQDGLRLHPRGSFALWSEEVRGRSLPWTDADLISAKVLRQKLLEIRQELLDSERLRTEQLKEQKEELIAALAHDLKTPILGSIRILEILKSKAIPESERLDIFEQLIKSQKMLYERVKSFFTAYKYDEKTGHFAYEKFDVGELIQQAVTICAPHALAENINIQIVSEPGLSVFGEPDAISRVIENLLHNAIKFSPIGGEVMLVSARDSDHVLIQVIDSGEGVGQEELPNLFKRFWQGKTSRYNRDGSGFGLYSCRQIIETHKGKIWCESSVGQGATFSIRLPCFSALVINDN